MSKRAAKHPNLLFVLILAVAVLVIVAFVAVVRTKVPLPLKPYQQEMVKLAKGDLAARLGTNLTQAHLVSVEGVTWSDSSMGCPQPGEMYLQVLTPGYRIQLWANWRIYSYHSGRNQPPFLCPNPGELIKVFTGD